MNKFAVAYLVFLAAIDASAKPVSALQFKNLKSTSSTIFECRYEFTSERTKETFSGGLRVSSVGEIFLASERKGEAVNECPLSLRDFQYTNTNASNEISLKASRREACSPRLSTSFKKRLDDQIEIFLDRGQLVKPASQRIAEVSVIYLEGTQPCYVSKWDDKALAVLAKRFEAGSVSVSSIAPAEPLDITDEVARLKREARRN